MQDAQLDFWAEQARRLDWEQDFTEVLDWSEAPFAQWFADGELNVAANCLDRHVANDRGGRVAYHWVGEPGDERDITFAELTAEVCQAANYLTSLGLEPGDRVAIYAPMVPETFVAILACARLGLPHSIVFAGFSPSALRQRVDDAEAKVVITTDGQYRRGTPAPLKEAVDTALGEGGAGAGSPAAESVEQVLVIRRTESDIAWIEGRDVWWHEAMADMPTTHSYEAFPAEHPLFLLYTSGTTGKPKGIVHTSGGYLTQAAYTHRTAFDLDPDTDIYWCTADIGWVTGHTYAVYGPLANGTTSVIYEGTPNTPTEHRHFEIIENKRVTIYYSAPTLVRTFMKWGDDIPAAHDLSSIRVLGTVGEPINPEAWRWFREHLGGGTAPIIDTWWQTETGAHMIAPLPDEQNFKPGSAQHPLPGLSVAVVDDDGKEVAHGEQGLLVVTEPWPSILRGIWGDDDRFRDTYWSRFPKQGYYFAGDGARYDEDGDIWVLGRVDDVMNVSGHRISTSEVESALVSHPSVAEAAVIGASDATTGQGIVAYCIPMSGIDLSGPEGDAERERIIAELRKNVSTEISPIAKPRDIFLVPELPKTRSGKIMRRLLRDLAEGREVGDTSTLADPTIMTTITEQVRAEAGVS